MTCSCKPTNSCFHQPSAHQLPPDPSRLYFSPRQFKPGSTDAHQGLGALAASLAPPEWLPSGPFNVGSMAMSFGMSPANILGAFCGAPL